MNLTPLESIEAFLYREASYLDQPDLESWIQLFTDDGTYWMPAMQDQPDPLNHISHFYDDRVLMEIRKRNFIHPRAASQEASGSSKEAKVNYELVISLHGTAPEALQARVALAKMILAQSNPDTVKAKELLLAASQESQAGGIPGFWGRESERMLASLPVQAETKAGSTEGISEETKKEK